VKVELGLTDRDHAEVVAGIDVGQEIVLAGHAGLKDGGLVARVDENGKPVEAPAEGVPVMQAQPSTAAGQPSAATPAGSATPEVAKPEAAPAPAKPKKKARRGLAGIFKTSKRSKSKSSAAGAADGDA
jgi:multidrug efflux system membrane fusion protein